MRKENTLSLVDIDLDNVIREGSEPESNLPWERLGVFRKLKKVLAGPCIKVIKHVYVVSASYHLIIRKNSDTTPLCIQRYP